MLLSNEYFVIIFSHRRATQQTYLKKQSALVRFAKYLGRLNG